MGTLLQVHQDLSGQQPLTNLSIEREETIRCLKNVVHFPSVESSQRVKYLSKRTTGIGPPEMSVRAIIVVFRIFLIVPAWGNRDYALLSVTREARSAGRTESH